MIFKDLILNTSWRAVSDSIARIYPDQNDELDQFKKVYTDMHTMTVQPSNLCIHMEWDRNQVPEPFDFIRVYAVNLSESGTEAGQQCLIDYEPWRRWLGMAVAEDTRKVFSDSDIVAVCLWEMTFHGYSE